MASWPYAAPVFDEQHTPEQITEYEVARAVLGARLGQALGAVDASDDPADRARWEAVADDVVRQRKALRVGSEEAALIVAEAKAARAGPDRE
jgi:hypothetical protein